MRYFNTSGPNITEEHYTLPRTELVQIGKQMVYNRRYFTIWAPRQTGKSTYFRFLADELEKEVTHPDVLENNEMVENVNIITYLVRYDLDKDFDAPQTKPRTKRKST